MGVSSFYDRGIKKKKNLGADYLCKQLEERKMNCENKDGHYCVV